VTNGVILAQETGRTDIHARREKEFEPRSVGTSAAFGDLPPIRLSGWQELTISCFKSFTKWSLPM
jgi:hypothetical protein